jgi:hypothetical protein
MTSVQCVAEAEALIQSQMGIIQLESRMIGAVDADHPSLCGVTKELLLGGPGMKRFMVLYVATPRTSKK